MPVCSIIPFYFGRCDKSLFGCYHEPHPAAKRASGVVIAQPVGHEYINSHRALRQLAVLLANVGFPVLRFDYYGCGDSMGEEDQATVSQWIEDTSTAISELRKRGNLNTVCVIGLRLAATIAVLAASVQNELAALVLWDAIIRGKDFLNEVRSLQNERMRCRRKPTKRVEASNVTRDFLGFAMSQSLSQSLETLEIPAFFRPAAKEVLVINSYPQKTESESYEHAVQSGTNTEYKQVAAPKIWEGTPEGTLLVPSQILRLVVSWMLHKNL